MQNQKLGQSSSVRPNKWTDIAVIIGIITFIVVLVVINVFIYEDEYEEDETPHGSLTYGSLDNPGEYFLNYGGVGIDSKDVKIEIYDASANKTAILENPTNGDIVSCGPGLLNLSYYDNVDIQKFSNGDTVIVANAAPGDIIKVIYIPTRGTIASAYITR